MLRNNGGAIEKVPKFNSKDGTSPGLNRTSLRLEELDFVPVCDIVAKEAISAIHRAKTQLCKQKLSNITCLIQQRQLYPHHLPNSCPSPGNNEKYSILWAVCQKFESELVSSSVVLCAIYYFLQQEKLKIYLTNYLTRKHWHSMHFASCMLAYKCMSCCSTVRMF
jgi:hypothetical protein